MEYAAPPARAAIARHPIHATLVPFPIVCFTFTLLTDTAYWRSGNLMWLNFSAWLLLAGVVVGALAAVAGLIDLLSRSGMRSSRIGWLHGIGNIVVLGLATLNSLVHARDGWTAVVPQGLILSTLTVLAMIATVWLGRSMVFRRGVGVSYD